MLANGCRWTERALLGIVWHLEADSMEWNGLHAPADELLTWPGSLLECAMGMHRLLMAVRHEKCLGDGVASPETESSGARRRTYDGTQSYVLHK